MFFKVFLENFMSDLPEAPKAQVDLAVSVERLRNRIVLLEDVIDDMGRILDRVVEEHQNELADLRSEIATMQGYRDEQIARAIAQHEIDKLAEQVTAAKRRHAILCSPGNAL